MKKIRSFLPIPLFSFLAGAVGGLFGTGGGILVVFLLSRIFKGNEAYTRKDIFAMTVLSVAIMSLSSLFIYWKDGAVSSADIYPVILPAATGGLCGVFLLDRIDTTLLNRIFALLILYAGAVLLLR